MHMDFVQGRTDCLRWLARRDWAETLVGPNGLRLEDWLGAGTVHVFKHGPHRTVYRVAAGERDFFVKHYRCSTFWDRARHLVRRSPARREWEHAQQVAERGIATATPLAWQEEKGRGPVNGSFLVTQAIPGGCPLDVYCRQLLPALAATVRRRVWRQLLVDFAALAARIHRAGIWHDDFHAGNFVVSLQEGLPQVDPATGRFQIRVIDLPGIRLSTPLDWRAVRGNLVALNASWSERVSPQDRYRFWRAYLAERPEMRLRSERNALRQVVAGTAGHRQRVLRKRDKRPLRNNRDYIRLAMPQGRAYGVGDFSPESLRDLFETSEGLLRRNLHRSVKLDHGTMIVEAEMPLGGRPVHIAMKRYQPRSWWKALLAPFRRARAVRGWRHGHALRLRNIATVRPIAACDVRRPWFHCRSYLVVEWIGGSENLHLYLWRMARQPHPLRFRHACQCAEQLGGMLGRMHAQNVLHSDLKASNLLVAEESGELRTYLGDLDDVSFNGNATLRQRATDLARLAVSIQAHPWISRTIVCRFLRAYQRQIGSTAGGWRPLWLATASRSERIVRRKRRKQQAIL